MFGTDDQASWPEIEETMNDQARIVQHPDGELRLSALGRCIERALAEDLPGGGGGAHWRGGVADG